MDKYQITQSAQLSSLEKFRQFIKNSLEFYPQLDEDFVYDLQLANDEACTNIIQHGYAGMDPGSIILNIEVDQGAVQMIVTDFGHAFEPSSAPMPDIYAPLEERQVGGFGLFFIYQAMDEVDYETDLCSNRLILKKYINTVK